MLFSVAEAKTGWDSSRESTSAVASNTRTLTRTERASTHPAPMHAQGQSTRIAPLSGVIKILSARMRAHPPNASPGS